jgi:hypothetical protein
MARAKWMEPAKMKSKYLLGNWLDQCVVDQKSTVHSIHFDRLDGYDRPGAISDELVKLVFQALAFVAGYMESKIKNSDVWTVVAFLPICSSDEILSWETDYWQKLSWVEEPPSLYFVKGSQLFEDDIEEYRRPVIIPFENNETVTAIFRSFRDRESMENSWEFTTGIYLATKL